MMNEAISIDIQSLDRDLRWDEHKAPRRARALSRPRHGALEILDAHPELRQGQEEYNINVTSQTGNKLSAERTLREIRTHDGADKPAHLYFHVPLCDYVCKFCNYVKRLAPRDDGGAALNLWTNLLIAESTLYLDRCDWLGRADIQSLYLGGGTASLLRVWHLERVLTHVREHYALAPNAEITLEGNPDNFLEAEAADAARIGFNRFSLGVQSLNDRVTSFTGRKHDAADSLRAIDKLAATGKPFNVDMMFGLPHQDVETVVTDIEELVARGVPTITIYRFRNALRHEMGIGNKSAWNNAQVITHMASEGLFPTLAQTYAMRDAITDVLLANNYHPSPCGWWSKLGTYPDGNIPQVSRNKWQHFDTMIAFGPGAYGWLSGSRHEVVQTHNIQDIAAYLQHMRDGATEPPLSFGRHLDARQTVATVLGFAFKANQPIELARFKSQYAVDLLHVEPYSTVLGHLLQTGFLEMSADGRSVRPTLDGETVHEEIISHYLHKTIGDADAVACKR
ncbi:radical SAM protein [Mesorhizobium sp. L2C084A000]|uniref:radical SAM protein n=1 Tax=Mesorhizobium sp. L2C084A000 TaxID=1287116 RepID=UPI0003D028DB|nr:radical SAM protein [Mesorhizobium sp. L2C084A000]ESZ22845.1 coproporphyrinogen III oxidase [Mesorhizobium sp. L2C084A000]